MLRLFIIIVLISGCHFRETKNQQPMDNNVDGQVIYGNDDRRDIHEVQDTFLLERARSTVALIEENNITRAVAGWTVSGENFGRSMNLCTSERFREQNTAAFCSGSLVGPDIVVTAGHCIRSLNNCQTTKFVFDFAVDKPGIQRSQFNENQVYGCSQVLATQVADNGSDYAVIRLDRKVEGRSPLKIRRSGAITVNDGIFVIGHPVGLPTKVATGAKVRKIETAHFVTNLDTYGGNSGSAVFNEKTGVIEGILVRGEEDFKWSGNCQVSNVCSSEGCRGEDVTKISEALPHIPDEEPDSGGEGEGSEAQYAVTVNKTIPDKSQTGVISVVRADAFPGGKKVKVEINIKHTYRGDLQISLSAPNGKSVVLHNRTGRNLDHIIGTYGEDLTAAESLATLSDVRQNGTWTLTVKDLVAQDVGTLVSWKLIFAD